MSCTCEVKDLHTLLAQRATCCIACPEHHGFTVCTVSGKLASTHVKTGMCPLGNFPDQNGVVTWLGVRWMGIPAPVRWASNTWLGRKAFGFRKPLPKLPGCGCLADIKAAWIRLTKSFQ